MNTLKRKSFVLKALGISKSTLHNRINCGLITPPISIGDRAVAWPSNEIESLINAQISGKSSTEIKLLVQHLVDNRQKAGAV